MGIGCSIAAKGKLFVYVHCYFKIMYNAAEKQLKTLAPFCTIA